MEPVRDDFREYATIDNFPTTLAAMGVEIEGDRLGLGTNLFSDQDTLVERDGLDYVNTELQKASAWMDEQSDLKEVKFDILKGDHLAVGLGHLRDGRLLSVSTFLTFVGIVGFFNGSF